MRTLRLTILTICVAMLALPAAASARLMAPGLLSPANGARVQQLPSISWRAVRGAAEYEYEISADPHFNSILGSGPGKGTNRTYNLAAALDTAVPDGTYSWRVRGVSASGTVGNWSATRRIVKRWTLAPRIQGGDGASVTWPTTPLVLSWSAVPYASKYIVTIATDPALSNVVLGSTAQPQYTEGTSFVFPTTLANGTYYWAVTPVDAEMHRGTRSGVGTFAWTWPTATTAQFTDLNPGVFDPIFSWNRVPGAARYDVEVNSASSFPAGSKWCCSASTIGTSLAPQVNLGNNSTYYWRVRAVDANGNAGQWNYGSPFTKVFDSSTPSVPGLVVRDIHGTVLSGVPAVDAPIVTWNPVQGASRYEIQLAPYSSYCDWSQVSSPPYHAYTATTAWTPLGSTFSSPGPSAWPRPQTDWPLAPGTYCMRVLARADDDAQYQQVVSNWTYLNATNSSNQPAFQYVSPQNTLGTQPFNPLTPANAYIGPLTGTLTPRTPLFTWQWLPGANGYFVVVARDSSFTNVVDVGFTNVPAYAPRLANGAPLADQTTSYYWAVIPTQTANGSGSGGDPTQDNAQSFDKYSIAPAPQQPANGASVSTWPTFEWTSAENARDYTLQVSADPSFGNLIDNVTTDGTAYTSSSTYPADTAMYWRVRANDWTGQGLNWSPVQTFTRRLPGASPLPGNPTSGDGISVFSWTGVPGAVSYDVHIDQGTGFSNDYTVDSTAFAATTRQGLGAVDWQVRPLFPTNNFFGTVGGPFFAAQRYVLTLSPPTGAHGVKSGSRLVVSWRPDPAATQYDVEVANSDSFTLPLDIHRVDGTSWAPDINLSLSFNRGPLYWRVAAIDASGATGSYVSGRFTTAPAAHSKPHKKPAKRKKKVRKSG